MREEIIIRQAVAEDAEALATIHVKIWQETYQGIIDQDYLDNMSVEQRANMWQKLLANERADTIYLVVTDGKKMVGFCSAGPKRGTIEEAKGEIYALNLLEGYKGIGVGLELFTQAREHLIKHDLLPFLVWVLPENKRACRFYEKLGGMVKCEEMIKIGEKEYREIGYVFE